MFTRPSLLRLRLRPVLVAAVCALAAAGCSPIVDNRGNLPAPEKVAALKPGVVNREDVTNLLGTPSSVSPLGGETWYYISSRTETFAFLRADEVDRKVVAIRFNKNGIVDDIRQFGLADGQDVQTVERETPTAGRDLNLLQQLLGNVGRFSSDKPTH